MTINALRYRWIILITIVVGLVVAGFSLIDVRQQMKRMDGNTLSGGPDWYVTNVEFDVLRLENSLLQFSHAQRDANDVHRAFDILWSRLVQMEVSAIRDTLVEYGVDMKVYERLMAALVASDSRVAALGTGPEGKGNALEIFEIFNQFNDDVRDTTLEVVKVSVLESNDFRLSVLGSAKTILYISLTITSVAGLLFLVFALDSVLTRRALIEKEALLQDAYAADIAKSQFISVMNHELRTPLTSISASLSLLKSGTLTQTPEKVSRLIEIAERNCRVLMQLVTDLLDTERFASGKMKFDFQVVDFSELLHRSVQNNQAYADLYGVGINADSIEPNVGITADPARIDQVMTNLLSNAIKFSKEAGKVQVSLTIEAGHAVVAVKDDGRGIPQEDQLRIFERFQQVDSTDRRERGGTGLGLSIVKAIVEAHHAEISLESRLGEGSTFYISFPQASGVLPSEIRTLA
ncbi:sensor histidine kinase [Roseovarius sp. Pro17]|uniref:sensor histidine kinase n=1 Tax=Roseovarius sp. Pro17 TaxID=3108175 RepID=UPI002D785379|nr:ATP-binding protein [Roseovarius sp. Pro17]